VGLAERDIEMRRTAFAAKALGLAAAGALVLTACGTGQPAPGQAASTGGADEFTTATLGTVSNLQHVGEYVAVQEGFYASNGLDVKLQVFASGSDANKALKAGSVQFGPAGSSSIPPARNSGLLIRLISGGMNDATSATYSGPLGIVGRSDHGITKDPESLRGKKIGVGVGSATEIYLRLFLAKHGMTLDDVKVVNLGVPLHPVSLKQGDVDAISSWDPYVGQAIASLGAKSVTVIRDEPDLYGYIIGVSALESTIKSNPDVLQKMVNALAQADAFIRQNPEKAAQDAVSYLPGLDVAVATEAIKSFSKWDPRISSCTEAAMKVSADDLAKSGKIDGPMAASDLVDASFIKRTEQEHPEWFSDLAPLPATC
jgi:ABC-type nitrate/sulfonate/bicarbonate transport system substrate-binding protein